MIYALVLAVSVCTPPAPHVVSETVDLGNGWGQTLWRDADGQPYDLGCVVRLSAPAPAPAPPVTVPDMIHAAAARRGVNGQRMMKIAWCESKFHPGAYNQRSGATGVFQFMPRLWSSTPYAQHDRTNAWANIEAAAWVMSQPGGFQHWRACDH